MPKVFSDEKELQLYNLLKSNCILLMKNHGYKGFNIRDLTKMTGISIGTFYKFYSSKESLIIEIMNDIQEDLHCKYEEVYRMNGGVDREHFINLYNYFFIEDENNILRYLSRDDLTGLFLRTNQKSSFDVVKSTMQENITYLYNPKKTINFNAVINFTQLINLCIENKDFLVEDELNNTIKKLIENLADEVFEEE